MNTFHTRIDQTKLYNTITDYINAIEKYETSCYCQLKNEITEIQSFSKQLKINGIAIKRSRLEELGICFIDLVEQTSFEILVDAEYERLDQWIRQHQLRKSQLQRLIFTVQAKRLDAVEQLYFFEKQGLRVNLVAGHNAYLDNKEQERAAAKVMVNLIDRFSCIELIGCGKKTKKRIEQRLGDEITEDRILELQGYHGLQNSKVWCYYSGSTLTKAASRYLVRRNSTEAEQFVATSFEKLHSIHHEKYVFIDGCDFIDYWTRVILIQRIKREKHR